MVAEGHKEEDSKGFTIWYHWVVEVHVLLKCVWAQWKQNSWHESTFLQNYCASYCGDGEIDSLEHTFGGLFSFFDTKLLIFFFFTYAVKS